MSTNSEGRHGLKPIYSAQELMAMELPHPNWALPGLLPEGVSLLVGAPKLGKSFLVLNLAIAVATGGVALGVAPVEQGSVLYAALEDTARRMKLRLETLLGNDPVPEKLDFTHELGRGEAMLEVLEDWLKKHADARLIIIDVLGRVAQVNRNNEHSYRTAYETIEPLKRLADDYGVAVVLVHHTRKGKDEDVFKEVSGSGGWVGAADTVIVLKRGRNSENVEMHLTGRDVAEAVWSMVFDAERGTWTVSGEPPWLATMRASRRRIFEHLIMHGGTTPKEIAEALGDMKPNTVQRTARRMADDGQLHTDGAGRYWALDLSAVSAMSVVATESAAAGRSSSQLGPAALSTVPVSDHDVVEHGLSTTDMADTTDEPANPDLEPERGIRPLKLKIIRERSISTSPSAGADHGP